MSREPQEDKKTWALIMDLKHIMDPDFPKKVIEETMDENDGEPRQTVKIKDETNTDCSNLIKIDHELEKTGEEKFQIVEMKNDSNFGSSATDETKENQVNSSEKLTLNTCYQCNVTFQHKGQLFHHEQVKHPTTSEFTQHIEKDGDLYRCTICSKTFPSNSIRRINKHLKLAHKLGADIQCSRCSKVFVFMRDYKIHLDVHDKVKKVVCDLCGKKLCDKYAMKKHRLYIHGSKDEQSKEKIYQCDICEKGFYLQSLLALHIQVHGEKNNLCHYCDESFRSKGGYTRHIKTKHLGEIFVKTEEMKVRARIGKVKRRAIAKLKLKEEKNNKG